MRTMLMSRLLNTSAIYGMGAAAMLHDATDIKAMAEKLAEITTQFNVKGNELDKKAVELQNDLKNKGTVLDSTKAEVDKLLVEHVALTKTLNETKVALTNLEQEVVKNKGNGKPEEFKSIGQQLIEDDGFKKYANVGTGGAASISRNSKYRFGVKAAVTSLDYPVSEPSIVQPQTVAPLPRLVQRLFVRDLLNVGKTGAPAIFWVKQTGFTNNARVVSENSLKPESTIAYDGVMTPVTTIAHLFKASKQIMDDFAMLRTDVDRELRYGLKYAEEQEILFGDGTGVHLRGIIPQASAYSHAFVPSNMTIIDDIRLMMLQAQLARLPATGIVMHFTDWARVELTKDTTGQYLWANPMRVGAPALWGLPVVPTEITAMLGKALVGAFRDGAQIYDREEINVEVATENNDDFEKNMITIRCEERVALATFRPEAFIYGAFTVTT